MTIPFFHFASVSNLTQIQIFGTCVLQNEYDDSEQINID